MVTKVKSWLISLFRIKLISRLLSVNLLKIVFQIKLYYVLSVLGVMDLLVA